MILLINSSNKGTVNAVSPADGRGGEERWCGSRHVLSSSIRPLPRAAGDIGRAEPLRHDAFESELAGMSLPNVSEGAPVAERPSRLLQAIPFHGRNARVGGEYISVELNCC
jgi:hypothetical protein